MSWSPLNIIRFNATGDHTNEVIEKWINEWDRIYGILNLLFHPTTGHKHTGLNMDAPQLTVSSIADGAITNAKLYGEITIDKISGGTVGEWSISGRPSSPITGQTGYNTNLAITERWNGTEWVRISGRPRGMIDMWSGSVASIPTGWVLADGIERAHPEGGNFIPPNLRNRFIVGAATDTGTYTPVDDGVSTSTYYAPGSTGGQDKHIQTTNEMASHHHRPRGSWGGNSNYLFNGYCDAFQGSINNGGGAYGELGSGLQAIEHTGGGQAHENRPPYYALCYLYKL